MYSIIQLRQRWRLQLLVHIYVHRLHGCRSKQTRSPAHLLVREKKKKISGNMSADTMMHALHWWNCPVLRYPGLRVVYRKYICPRWWRKIGRGLRSEEAAVTTGSETTKLVKANCRGTDILNLCLFIQQHYSFSECVCALALPCSPPSFFPSLQRLAASRSLLPACLDLSFLVSLCQY